MRNLYVERVDTMQDTHYHKHSEFLTWGPIDQFHKSQNAPVPYPTMLHSEQKCAHFCSEWGIVG